MKTRIFVVLLLLCLNFSTILTANASKYYFESYEQSEMYADANVESGSDKIIEIDQDQIKNKSDSKDVVKENNINFRNEQINHTIRIITNGKNNKTNSNESISLKKNSSGSKKEKKEKNEINKATKKKKEKNDRLNFYFSGGLSGFVVSKFETNTGDIRSSVASSITDIESLKELIKSERPYLINFAVGTKFFFSKKSTGPFLSADFFFKYLFSASFNTSVLNSVEGTLYNLDGGIDSFKVVKTEDSVIQSEYKSVLKAMYGFSIKGGFSVDRLSFYGKVNLAKLQASHYIEISNDSLQEVKNTIQTETRSQIKEDYKNNTASLLKSESGTNWTKAYGAGFGIDINITRRIFLQLEYDHWWFSNKWITKDYSNSNGSREFTSEGNFGVVTLGIGIKFLGFAF